MTITRRDFLATGAAAIGAAVTAGGLQPAAASDGGRTSGGLYPHRLPALPYAMDALSPTIDAETMALHHGKHHQAYVDKLNDALAAHPQWQAAPLEVLLRDLAKLPDAIHTAVRNQGGGHANHTMFWSILSPAPQTEPKGELLQQVNAAFGSVTQLQEKFNDAGAKLFGSGWVFVVADMKGGALTLETRANQDTPLMEGRTALFGNDVWEHAYYVSYRNRRADYLKAWWNVLDWAAVEARLKRTQAGEVVI